MVWVGWTHTDHARPLDQVTTVFYSPVCQVVFAIGLCKLCASTMDGRSVVARGSFMINIR